MRWAMETSHQFRREYARGLLPHPGRLQEDARGRRRLSGQRAIGRIHILLECRHRSPGARGVCDV